MNTIVDFTHKRKILDCGDKGWAVVPTLRLPMDMVQTYWQTLHMHDTLKYRLCDVVDPTWADVKVMMRQLGNHMYSVMDEYGRILSEFAFCAHTGRSAQVHFSMHPENETRFNYTLAREVTDMVLEEWNHPDGGPYLCSIYGLTPVTNRVACLFVQRVGFKKVGILPGGMFDRGKVVDAMVTVKALKIPREV